MRHNLLSRMVKSALLFLLRAYKLCISPLLGQNCRFYPSCSDYAQEAIQEYGACKGSQMTAARLCKCHPWHQGGIDLVPKKTAQTASSTLQDRQPKN